MVRILCVALLLLAVPLAATDWSTTLDEIEKKVVRLRMQAADDDGPGTCSGVVINAEAGIVLTAAHCVDGADISVTVNGRHAEVVKVNRIIDLALVKTNRHRSFATLPLAATVPKMGTEVAVVGFPFGDEKLHTQFGHIARESGEGELWVNADLIPGDSGGALINPKGELVGINVAIMHNGPAHMGIAVPIETIRDFVQGYLPVPPSPKGN